VFYGKENDSSRSDAAVCMMNHLSESVLVFETTPLFSPPPPESSVHRCLSLLGVHFGKTRYVRN